MHIKYDATAPKMCLLPKLQRIFHSKFRDWCRCSRFVALEIMLIGSKLSMLSFSIQICALWIHVLLINYVPVRWMFIGFILILIWILILISNPLAKICLPNKYSSRLTISVEYIVHSYALTICFSLSLLPISEHWFPN